MTLFEEKMANPTNPHGLSPSATSSGSKDHIFFINRGLVSNSSLTRAQLAVAVIRKLMA